jgi:D-aminoacyl-tRNA deacylase
MKVVLQRVTRAEVRVRGATTGRIDHGFVVLAGFADDDDDAKLIWMADKIVGLRLFRDERAPACAADAARRSSFELSLADVGGGLLVISQFTLFGDARRGRRPSFIAAAPPERAVALYERFVALLRERTAGPVETGEFGAMMAVELINDGPVTLILER